MSAPRLFATGTLDALAPASRASLLARGGADEDVAHDVATIGAQVRADGDRALVALTEKFDRVMIDSLEVPPSEWDAALARLPSEVQVALRVAHENIARYHTACMPRGMEMDVIPGLRAGRRSVPIRRVGAYVPGGRAAYPSTVLMTATPAKVAGVDELIVVTPPGPGGKVPDATLAACAIAGVDRVFRVGGAQAIFALAYGTTSIPQVAKIVGPGNAWVAAAKAAVAGRVAIDAPAGPSEVLILASANADAELIAREMIAQAEHDPRASSIALVETQRLHDAVIAQLATLVASTPRHEIVEASLASRGAVLVADHDAMLAFSDEYAPEHLSILTAEPRADLARLSEYGSAFLGPWSTVALGDYASGPNHVLPTAGLARGYSGLGVEDFLRRPTHQEATREGLLALAPVVETLATLEGLHAHAAAVAARRERK